MFQAPLNQQPHIFFQSFGTKNFYFDVATLNVNTIYLYGMFVTSDSLNQPSFFMSIESDIRQTAFNSSYHRLLVNILYSGNWIGNTQMRILKPYGITLQQFNVLRILRGSFPNPVKVNEITERMLDKMSNASRLVDKLLVKKLVERTECPSDRRAVNVIITQKGFGLLTKIDAAQLQFEGIMAQRLTIEEANTLSHLLDQLRGSELTPTEEEQVG